MARLFSDETLSRAVRNTVFFTVAGTILEYALGLLLAISVLQIKRWQRFFRVIFLLPMMISPAAVGYVIGRMLFSETQGPINNILFRLGLPFVPWISNPGMAPWTIVIADVWQWTSFMFVLPGRAAVAPRGAVRGGPCRWGEYLADLHPDHLPAPGASHRHGDPHSLPELFKLIDLVRVITAGVLETATQTVTLYVYDLA